MRPGPRASFGAPGFDGEHIVEVIAHVALNLFTKSVNLAFAVAVGFAPVPLRREA